MIMQSNFDGDPSFVRFSPKGISVMNVIAALRHASHPDLIVQGLWSCKRIGDVWHAEPVGIDIMVSPFATNNKYHGSGDFYDVNEMEDSMQPQEAVQSAMSLAIMHGAKYSDWDSFHPERLRNYLDSHGWDEEI